MKYYTASQTEIMSHFSFLSIITVIGCLEIPSYLRTLPWECYLAEMPVSGLHVYFYRPSYFKGAWSYWHSSFPPFTSASKQAHCSCFLKKHPSLTFLVWKSSLLPTGLAALVSCRPVGDLWVVFYSLGFYWSSASFSFFPSDWVYYLMSSIQKHVHS